MSLMQSVMELVANLSMNVILMEYFFNEEHRLIPCYFTARTISVLYALYKVVVIGCVWGNLNSLHDENPYYAFCLLFTIFAWILTCISVFSVGISYGIREIKHEAAIATIVVSVLLCCLIACCGYINLMVLGMRNRRR